MHLQGNPFYTVPGLFFGGLVSVVLFLGGCRKESAEVPLQGVWVGVHVDGVDAAQQASADAFATALRLEFRDRELTFVSQKGQLKTPFRVEAREGDTLTLVTEADGISAKQKFQLEGEKTLKWRMDEKYTILFRR